MNRWRTWFVRGMACLTASVTAHGGAAQSAPKPAADSFICPDCTHRAALVTVLGAGSVDGPDFSIFTRVSKAGGGRFIAGPVNGFKDVAVYRANGKFERMLGGRGAGPGEYRTPGNCGVLPGDSVWVFDVTLRRLSIFGPDLKFVRSMPFLDHRSLAFAPAGVITGLGEFSSDKTRAGHTLHQYDATTGNHIRSFGGRERLYGVMSDSRGTVWAVAPDPVRIVSFAGNGTRDREVRVQPAWMPFPTVKPRMRPGRPATGELAATPPIMAEPLATVNSVSVVANGDLWILGGVPAQNWQKGTNPYEPPPPERKGVVPVRDPSEKIRALNSWYDGIVEVVNVDQSGRSRTIARAKFAGAMSYFLGDGMFSSMTADDDGVVTIKVWRLQAK